MPDALLRLRYRESDGAGATGALRAVLGSGTVTALADPLRWSQDSLVDDGITISRVRVEGALQVDLHRTAEMVIIAVRRGEVELGLHDQQLRLRPSELALVPMGASARLVLGTAEVELFILPAAPLARLLGTRTEALRLTAPRVRPRSAALAAYFGEVCRLVTSSTFEREEIYQRDLIRGGAIALLAATVVETFDLVARAEQNPDRDQAVVRRAVASMRQHLGDSVSIPEIAAAAGVSVRGLQLAFRRQLDVSPLLHLRQLRLEAARDELAARRRSGATIAEIAGSYGYSNAARFSTYYRNAFDEAPSAALDRIADTAEGDD